MNRRRQASARLLNFCLVGGVGFGVDAGVLYWLVGAGWSPYLARLPSFLFAVAATWALNRSVTFRDSRPHGRLSAEYFRYVAVQSVGASVNYAVFSLVLALHRGVVDSPVVALAVASVIAMGVNYLGSLRFVFNLRASAAKGKCA